MNENYKKAVEIRNVYFNNKSINFPEELNKLGYDNVDEFLFDDAEYFLENTVLKVEYMTDPISQSDIVINALSNKQDKAFIVTPESKFVWVGNNTEYNKEYCEQNNIPFIFEPYNSGAICTDKNDLQLAFSINDMPVKFQKVISDRLVNWLKLNVSKNISTDGNDILIENKKVVGFGRYTLENGMTLLVVQISFVVDLDFIRNVTNKEIKKIPVDINEYNLNISRNDLIWEVLKWLY